LTKRVTRNATSVSATTHLTPEDGGGKVLRNAGIQPPHYTVQQPRKPLILIY